MDKEAMQQEVEQLRAEIGEKTTVLHDLQAKQNALLREITAVTHEIDTLKTRVYEMTKTEAEFGNTISEYLRRQQEIAAQKAKSVAEMEQSGLASVMEAVATMKAKKPARKDAE